MALSEVDIINEALLMVGQKETIASRDEDSTAADVANRIYDRSRDKVLAAGRWPFARRHSTLALLDETRSGWKNVYALPQDCIAPRYIFNGARPGLPAFYPTGVPANTLPAGMDVGVWPPVGAQIPPAAFGLEASADGSGQVLMTDLDEAELIYTAQIKNPLAFTPLFEEALELFLASRFALSLPVKAGLGVQLKKEYEEAVKKALAAAWISEQRDPPAQARHVSVRG